MLTVHDNQVDICSLTIGIRFQRSQWSLSKTSCKYILAYMAIKKAMSEIESIISDTDELWEILDECACELKHRTFI